MKSPEDELMAHIKERLIAHEEDYAPGAWENFNKDEGKTKGLFFWIGSLSAAAALILIGFAIFLTVTRDMEHKPIETARLKPLTKPSEPLKETPRGMNNIEEINQAKIGDAAENIGVSSKESHSPVLMGQSNRTIVQGQGMRVADAVSVASPADVKENSTVIADTKIIAPNVETVIAGQQVVAKNPVEQKKDTFLDFLNRENKTEQAAKNTNSMLKRQSKWEMGLVVAPSFGNSKKLNMGYGFSMGYALSDKVSISSGIAYNEMGATKNIGSDQSNTANVGVASESKELQSVDANLRGIDIPLEIKYNLSKRIYANVGVSAFAVLDQRQKNNFLESKFQSDPQASDATSFALKTIVVNKSVSEEVPKAEVRDDRYLGFYNISVGYRQKIPGGKSFAVEPFLKLPIKEFTKENLYLIGTGLKLKFDF